MWPGTNQAVSAASDNVRMPVKREEVSKWRLSGNKRKKKKPWQYDVTNMAVSGFTCTVAVPVSISALLTLLLCSW